MEKITKILTETVSAAFESAGYSPSLGAVSVSDRTDLCQFQCNGALSGAKLYHKAPMLIAGDVVAILSKNPAFSLAKAVPPGFINLSLTDEFLAEIVNEISADPCLGVPQVEKPETVVIDYGGPNVAKALHIGHLRSAIIGESLKRTARATGRKVFGDVHFGDWGTPYGLTIAEYKVRHPDWPCFREDFDPEKDVIPEIDEAEMNEIYPCASLKSKSDEEFKLISRQTVVDLQNRKKGVYDLWKKIKDVSVKSVRRIYEKLGVDFDVWYGESDSDRYTPELIKILTEKGLLHESEGAQVVDVAEEGDKISVPPILVKKSDGSSIYATFDLATIIQREHDFKPDRIWYLTDKRQSLHFMQVFRCAKKAGLVPPETELRHLGFGAMTGPDGKPFKTRDGGVMPLETLIDTVESAAMEKLKDSEYITSDKEGAARKIGIAALKFADLSNQPTKDYIFDPDKFLSFDGKTGTYLLYTVTRINSILKKAGIGYDDVLEYKKISSEGERGLALLIALSGESYERAFEDMNPAALCDSAYGIASAFSRFYHDNRILTEEDAEKRLNWLGLCSVTRRVLVKLLDCLGIEAVENM